MHSKKMDFDAILPKLGGFGKWQILTTTLCSLCAVGGGIITMTYSFTGKMQLLEKKCHQGHWQKKSKVSWLDCTSPDNDIQYPSYFVKEILGVINLKHKHS